MFQLYKAHPVSEVRTGQTKVLSEENKKGNSFHADVCPARMLYRIRRTEMKWIVITIIVLIGLLDFALLIACSYLEDREQYKYEEWLRREDDEGHDI